jgi:hypothetical protein
MARNNKLLITIVLIVLVQGSSGIVSGIDEQRITPVNDNTVNAVILDVFVEYVDCYEYGYDYVDLSHVIRIDVNNKILKSIHYWQDIKESDGVFNRSENGKNIHEYKIVKIIKNDDVYKFYLPDKIFKYDTEKGKADFDNHEFIPLDAIRDKNLVFINCNIYMDTDLDLPFNENTVNSVKNVWQYYCEINMEQAIMFYFCWKYVHDRIELFIVLIDIDKGIFKKTYSVEKIYNDNNESIVFVLDDNERLTIKDTKDNNYYITGPGIEGLFFGCI